MSKCKTLREVCEMTHVSRRAIQGYEAAGLLAPSGKNKYGYLLYDETAVETIVRIKRYQQFGFCLKEIKWLQGASKQEVKEALEEKLLYLEERQDELCELIAVANLMIGELSLKS